ncbi:MAG: MarR family winged helix-turn-helix transcriptional regulator [Hylemonella sp.]
MNAALFRVSDWPMAHFARIERQHQANANALLKPHGLKHAEWRILALTDELESVSLTQIVDLVVIERTTIGKLIDRMVQRGWLDKGKSATDARAMQVTLTPLGRRLLHATAPGMLELMKAYAEALKPTEFERLMASLRRYGQQVKYCDPHRRPDTPR